jgi:hypothetical protein
MTKLEPIIAVKDVVASSSWYQAIFGCKSMHGGEEFEVLKTEKDDVLICLHKWAEHDHPTMKASTAISGNGLILYIRTENLEEIRQNVAKLGQAVESEIKISPNSHKKEFTLRDLDGYYLIVSEYHTYQG